MASPNIRTFPFTKWKDNAVDDETLVQNVLPFDELYGYLSEMKMEWPSICKQISGPTKCKRFPMNHFGLHKILSMVQVWVRSNLSSLGVCAQVFGLRTTYIILWIIEEHLFQFPFQFQWATKSSRYHWQSKTFNPSARIILFAKNSKELWQVLVCITKMHHSF